MVRLAILLVALPLVLSAPSEKQGRSLVIPGSTAAAGAVGAQYGQQTGASETHDKKNFGLNFNSDRGTSNQFSNTAAQAGVAGSVGQVQGYQGYPYYPPTPYYPSYPSYPSYPYHPNVGVGAGVGIQGVPGNVGVGAVSGVGVQGVPYRYY